MQILDHKSSEQPVLIVEEEAIEYEASSFISQTKLNPQG
jgi:hypothetical protein